MLEEVRFPSDDGETELVIFAGGNSDWYICVTPEGEGCIGRCVRIRTSGGASSTVPGLTVAVANMYRAILSAKEKGTLGGLGFAAR